YVIERAGQKLPMTIEPRDMRGRGAIGVVAKLETRTKALSVVEAGGLALRLPWSITVQNIEGIVDMVQRRTSEGVTGPVGMAKHVASQAEKGLYAYLSTLVLLSVAVGFFNLL